MQLLPKRPPKKLMDPVVDFLISLGITPNMLTVCGFFGSVFAAFIIATGNFFIGGIFVLLFSAIDMFDGAVARKSEKNSNYGAVLDSTLDRFSEIAILGGVFMHSINENNEPLAILCFFALSGSLMVSYIRARGEGLGISLNNGFAPRPERIIIISVALIFNWVLYAIIILLAITWITSMQRLFKARVLLSSKKGND
ncbi:MAG: CDP-alcohol phosphatidyltransferase [Chloroflexi bacterium]|nr:CDP-alcohol phosphatidyltransferase [Chloroflexota bacterium]|tara:strand:+ start:339 stop:929 length:591 start_codon:yes stop_codon:yes gene_type:complete